MPEEYSTICCMTPQEIMSRWSTGDGWSWEAEMADLDEWGEMDSIMDDIQVNGIREPVLLGNDGRVWDGHHRIIAAHRLGIDSVPYEQVA